METANNSHGGKNERNLEKGKKRLWPAENESSHFMDPAVEELTGGSSVSKIFLQRTLVAADDLPPHSSSRADKSFFIRVLPLGYQPVCTSVFPSG